jgi:hypothetical protein
VPLREGEPGRSIEKPRRLWPWLLAAALLGITVALVATMGDRGLHPDAPARSFVAKASELRIPLGDLAEITLRPGSEVKFVHWREKKERCSSSRAAASKHASRRRPRYRWDSSASTHRTGASSIRAVATSSSCAATGRCTCA